MGRVIRHFENLESIIDRTLKEHPDYYHLYKNTNDRKIKEKIFVFFIDKTLRTLGGYGKYNEVRKVLKDRLYCPPTIVMHHNQWYSFQNTALANTH